MNIKKGDVKKNCKWAIILERKDKNPKQTKPWPHLEIKQNSGERVSVDRLKSMLGWNVC